jgi:tripartite-type tricarboxylate transporter receptor subunit TctC
MLTRRNVTFGTAALLASLKCPASAQTPWPKRPVRLIVPLSAGGGVDMMARVLAEQLSIMFGEPVVVENRPGAGGTIAAFTVARSDPDGYTLLFQSVSSAVINGLVYKNLSYDPIGDFAPVSLWAQFPNIIIMSKTIPAKNLQEFIALLKQNPGKYSYGSSGVGTAMHIAGELFKKLAGVDLVHIPYKGNSAAMTDLLGGRLAIIFDGIAPQLPYIRDGRVIALGVTTSERSSMLPDVPAVNEIVPGYEIPYWTAVFAPAKTPKEIIDKIAQGCSKAAKDPEVIRRMQYLGVEVIGSSPEKLDTFWRKEINYYADIVKASNISIAQ